MLIRKPHPVACATEARANRARICDQRGFCGPFHNEEYYASFGDPIWFGAAECVHCCSTVHVATELEKWESAIWHRSFAVTLH